MWEMIKDVLNGANAVFILGFILIIVVFSVVLIKKGYIRIQTKAVKIGDSSEQERMILQQQIDQARVYIMSLESKILLIKPASPHSYFTKYILEQVFDEVVQWITFNHITDSTAYIHVKQLKVSSLVYSLGPSEEFKTKEFKTRMDNWVEELIKMLLDIRKVYSCKSKKK